MQNLIVVPCGPWRNSEKFCSKVEGGHVDYDRIDRGVSLAVADPQRSGLAIVGDANRGQDVLDFANFALDEGVSQENLFYKYDRRMSTIFDCQSIGLMLQSIPCLINVKRLIVVTHWWHMPRKHEILKGELTKILGHCPEIIEHRIVAGPRPDDKRLAREEAGIEKYRNGTYVPNSDPEPLGKPDAEHSFAQAA